MKNTPAIVPEAGPSGLRTWTTSISLSQAETLAAAVTGVMRNLCATYHGRETKFGGDSAWQIHIEGACGELAVAKALNIHNSHTINTFKEADLGRSIQVRTRSKGHYDLIVRPDDDDDEVFVLVTGAVPDFEIRGWIWGREAKQEKYRANYGGYGEAWFVPAAALRHIETIPDECKEPRV